MSRADSVAEAAKALAAADEVAMLCHVGPDGDALGSMLGLGLALQKAGKKVTAGFAPPFVVPASLSFLPGQDLLVSPDAFPASPAVLVLLDAGSPDRVGELAPSVSAAATVIVLDHHVTNEGFGDIPVVDGQVAATGQIAFEVIEAMGIELDDDIALCLLTALVTDTGRFQYSNTTAETLRTAAKLVAAGGDPAIIGRHVYEEVPFGYLHVAGSALSRAVLHSGLGVVTTTVTHADLADAGVDWGDIDSLIDTLRLAVEADTAILAKSFEDGRVKVSLRSRGATDVGGLAATFGGGGHRLAAGLTVEAAPEDVVGQLLERIEEFR